MNLGMSGGRREYLGDCKLATGGSPRPASAPYERTRSWALPAPPLGQHAIANCPVIPIRDTTAFTVRVKGAVLGFLGAIYRPAPAGGLRSAPGHLSYSRPRAAGSTSRRRR